MKLLTSQQIVSKGLEFYEKRKTIPSFKFPLSLVQKVTEKNTIEQIGNEQFSVESLVQQFQIIFVQLMTKKLSEAFFGDKKFTSKAYQQFADERTLSSQDVRIIFEPYTSKLVDIQSKDQQISLFSLFAQFIQGVASQFADWQFQKLSSILEISAHVFEHSFEEWLSKEQSFKYFTDVVVRHSLFRPPHSVCVFNYDQLTRITEFWLNHFHRYFDYYRECMSSSLNEVLICNRLPQQVAGEKELKQARAVDKSEVLKMLV